ncbi:hypothetical protein DFH28DRAFT_1087152 [Melampsora americana]|nr:hypothetical protein DFH28DRAFT_1087152 [Melampsora americana]
MVSFPLQDNLLVYCPPNPHPIQHHDKAWWSLHQQQIPPNLTFHRPSPTQTWSQSWPHLSGMLKQPFVSLYTCRCGYCQGQMLTTSSYQCQTTPHSSHYFRTFKLNQLNHEIALINAGHEYPIPYEPSAFGPPVNINGDVLPSQGDTKDADTPNLSKRTPPQMPCARIKEGPTSKKHKDKGHTGCKYLYCKSCCHEFGIPGECYPHRVNPPSTQHSSNQLTLPYTQPSLSSNQLASNQSTNCSTQSTTSSADIPTRKRIRLLPEQCSQSVHRIGRIMTEDGEQALASARLKQEDTIRKASAPSIDTGKVVSLHLVTNPSTPVISHHFPNWPTAILNECPSLLREAQAAAGPDWNKNLLVWDEPVKNRREIGVAIPHKYTRSSRNLVICVPSQRAELSNALQDILEGLGLGKPNIPKLPKIEVPEESKARQSDGSQQAPVCILDSDSDMDLPMDPCPAVSPGAASSVFIPHASSSHNKFKHFDPALFSIVEDQTDTKPTISGLPGSNNKQLIDLKEWPGKDALASDLVLWAKAMGVPAARHARIPQWVRYFGATYQLQPPTVYRYASFVDEVDYYRLKRWVEAWPEEGSTNKHNLTISQVRRHFQHEFNIVSKLVKNKKTDTTSPPKSCKRKSYP